MALTSGCTTIRADGSREGLNVGSFINSPPDQDDHRFMKLDWITHIQLSGLRFTIHRGPAYTSVRVWLYANTLRHRENKRNGAGSAQISHDVGDDVQESIFKNLGLATEPRDTGTIWRTALQAWSDSQVIRNLGSASGLQAARPQVSGILQADIDRIIAAGDEAPIKGDGSLLFGC